MSALQSVALQIVLDTRCTVVTLQVLCQKDFSSAKSELIITGNAMFKTSMPPANIPPIRSSVWTIPQRQHAPETIAFAVLTGCVFVYAENPFAPQTVMEEHDPLLPHANQRVEEYLQAMQEFLDSIPMAIHDDYLFHDKARLCAILASCTQTNQSVNNVAS
jgi:hypothetical protein